MHREVHLAEPDGFGHPVGPIHRDFGSGVLLMVLNEPGTLNKHATRSTCRVQDETVVGLDDLNDKPDQAGRCEELPTLLPLLHRELSKEILVYLAERIALDVVRNGREDPDQFKECGIIDPLVVLRQHIPEFFIFRLDGFHRVVDCLADIRSLRKGLEVGEPGLIGDEKAYPRLKIGF